MRKGQISNGEWPQRYQELLDGVKKQNDLEFMTKINSRWNCDRDCKTCSEDDKILCINDLKLAIITACAELVFMHVRFDEQAEIIKKIAAINETQSKLISKEDAKKIANGVLEEKEEDEKDHDKEERPQTNIPPSPEKCLEPANPTIIVDDSEENRKGNPRPDYDEDHTKIHPVWFEMYI
jgi:hypothetical protein